MNETIRLLNRHRSIRRYTQAGISEEELEAIIQAAQMASSSSGVQAYSVIAVTDPAIQKTLGELCGNQPYVSGCPLFLVWCADLNRLETAVELVRGKEVEVVQNTENFLIATVDTALAAQNAAVAAESLGYGIVYIGGIRNRIAEVAELLGLPELVYPVFGMCLGHPAEDPILRPRLPLRAVLHRNRYDATVHEQAIREYDAAYKQYMDYRTNGRANPTWSEAMAGKLSVPARAHMKNFLQEKGFRLE
jgi:FMN reductase (NADPH)